MDFVLLLKKSQSMRGTSLIPTRDEGDEEERESRCPGAYPENTDVEV